MGMKHTAAFRQAAVRGALTRGATIARQAIGSIDERGVKQAAMTMRR